MRLFLQEETFPHTHPLPSLYVRFHPLENKLLFIPFPCSGETDLNEVGGTILGRVHLRMVTATAASLDEDFPVAFLLFWCQLLLVPWGGGGGRSAGTDSL